MPKIIIDGREIECDAGVPVLQAALDAGFDVPHYCYHPGLSVVASCRLCLMEMKMPHPKTKEMGWAPKMFPSCQTPVQDGGEYRFASDAVTQNQQHVMEYYLINHPLDCPVCDKAGECSLQDYSEKFGNASSRMVEDKHKNPKKDIGSHTLLYSDRCVMCTRCVRFCDEIAGEGELRVVNRGARNEIDVFPGVPLENDLQGNVVDLCPVGALLDKEFLFKQRVWFLRHAKSVSPVDSAGQTIWIDYNDHGVHRVRPRFNEKVNQWWISDEARFGWKHVRDEHRLNQPRMRDGDDWESLSWEDAAGIVRDKLSIAAGDDDGAGCAFVLSPFMASEEAYLLAKFARAIAPRATLALGPVPVDGQDKTYPGGFVVKAEKCPNRRGVEAVLKAAGGPQMSFDELITAAEQRRFRAAYVYGGYIRGHWISADQAAALDNVDTLITHDLFGAALDQFATVQLPAAAWAEREGSFMNCDGLVQAFERALPPLDGVKADGQFFFELAGQQGLYRGKRVREMMAEAMPDFAESAVFVPRDLPKHAH